MAVPITQPAPSALQTRRTRRVLPGFGLSLGYTLLYLSLLVLLPLGVLLFQASEIGPGPFRQALLSPRTLAAFRLSFGASALAALVNAAFGLLVAWTLTRYSFPGRRLIDGLVDLPFALPTAVAGISLSAVYAQNGWLGRFLVPHGVSLAYTPNGVTLALIFVGLPFVVRTVQPVLLDLEADVEEAASSLGASRGQIFARVLFPPLLPALLTGTTLAFARGLGEYGSVIFLSNNLPGSGEIVPKLIVDRLDQFDYPGATAIAVVMLLASFALLLLTNALQWWTRRRLGMI